MNRYLWSFDFDGTAAKTFEPSPAKIGVKEAYALAVKDVLGNRGLDIYNEKGCLKNQAPSELVASLLGSPFRDSLFAHAKSFFETNQRYLLTQVPEGKGVSLEQWKEDIGIVAELLVRQKLSYLLKQIGTTFPDGDTWPRPCNGFRDFWTTIQDLKKERLPLDTSIISSGHDKFIKRTFQLWGLISPDILVTEDDIRGRKYPEEMERRVKPGQLQLALAHKKWLDIQEIPFDPETVRQTRQEMMYFGDSYTHDGGLAAIAGIPFGWFNPDNKLPGEGRFNPETIVISNWREVASVLQSNQKALREGKPCNEIFAVSRLGTEQISARGLER
jgi:hypothetical protein